MVIATFSLSISWYFLSKGISTKYIALPKQFFSLSVVFNTFCCIGLPCPFVCQFGFAISCTPHTARQGRFILSSVAFLIWMVPTHSLWSHKAQEQKYTHRACVYKYYEMCCWHASVDIVICNKRHKVIQTDMSNAYRSREWNSFCFSERTLQLLRIHQARAALLVTSKAYARLVLIHRHQGLSVSKHFAKGR